MGISRNNRLCTCGRFDVALLFKSFNRLNSDEKEKILKNLLLTVKSNGLVFVYESEWTKDDSKWDSIFKEKKNFSYFLSKENRSSNPVDVIHYFRSAQISDNDKSGFDLIYARPLRSYVEVKSNSLDISMLEKLFFFRININRFIFVISFEKSLEMKVIRPFKIFSINNNIPHMVFWSTRKSLDPASYPPVV